MVLKLGIPDRIIALPDQGNEVSYRGSGVRDGAVYQCRLVFTTDAEGIILTHSYTVSPMQFADFYGKYGT